MSEEANIPNQKSGDSIHNSELNKATENPQKAEISEPQPQVQTNDMETHAQHLHKVPGQGWKHYFFEFFMLFLAVTLGFFVENLREKIIETHREREYAQQLYSELNADSIVLANKIAERKHKEKTMEYVASYFIDSSLDKLPERFYPALTMSLYLINRYEFEPKDGILSQLRNSGSLRYFKSVHLQKLLGDISVSINNIRERNNQEYQYWSNPIKPFMLKYFDFNWLTQLRNINDTSAIAVLIYDYEKYDFHVKGVIRNIPTLDRSEASNIILFFKQMLVSTRTLQLNDYIQTSHKILEVLRDNYSMKNE